MPNYLAACRMEHVFSIKLSNFRRVSLSIDSLGILSRIRCLAVSLLSFYPEDLDLLSPDVTKSSVLSNVGIFMIKRTLSI